MPWENRDVDTLADLLREAQSLPERRQWIFRGVALYPEHKLMPGIVRAHHAKDRKPIDLAEEKTALNTFRSRHPDLAAFRLASELEWMIIGQHHKLPTRLLDWTRNPLVAAHFVISELPETMTLHEPAINEVHRRMFGSDAPPEILEKVPQITFYREKAGAIYATRAPREVSTGDQAREPYSISEVMLVDPPHISERIPRQQSVFTIHPRPFTEWQPEHGIIFKISGKAKKSILQELPLLGVSAETLFPSVDTMAQQIAFNLKWGHPL